MLAPVPVPVKALLLRRAAMAGTADRRPARWTAAVAAVAAVAEGSLALLEQEPQVGMLFAALAGLEKTPEAVSAHAAAVGGRRESESCCDRATVPYYRIIEGIVTVADAFFIYT